MTAKAPIGFFTHVIPVGGIDIEYARGGEGPTVVLLHGYPQTWYEWRGVMLALAEHYTVIAPSLRGAGRSSAPLDGYDKKTMAADVHALLRHLNLADDVRLVGHDIGSMVAYAYAAQFPGTVRRLVLSEAPIPDESIYRAPALTAAGPGAWNWGFFNLEEGTPESVISGRERTWVEGFIGAKAVQKHRATDATALDEYALRLSDPAHLRASLAWFRAFDQDVADNAEFGKTPLEMPILAVGAASSHATRVADQVRQYARHVQGVVVDDCGHWLYEEQPLETARLLRGFLA
ncbi:alpha/beta fold hydrolase [Streptomyces sp. NBC_00271]|uniref:alpha/beta fold hydrolase n=1 Tax=Streptomyces sp. NBC_00271 TaxID=2975697 RepID=UPI002E2E41F2|nr:alpha/beta hydrolase [Streptomyces sp. NBC_00271]